MSRKQKQSPRTKPIVYIVITLLSFGCGYKLHDELKPKETSAIPLSSKENIQVYFSPRGGCTDAIVRAIDSAKDSIYVFAFSFTSKPIAEALVRVFQRGVEVRILADRGQSRGRGCKLSYLRNYGIPIWIDKTAGYAHNKIIIIDRKKVIGGSFNFSASAEYRNAENVTIITSQLVASKYIDNWHMRMKNGYPYSNEAA